MAAAVEIFSGRRKAHVVVLRSRRLGPFTVLVYSEPVMARDHQPLAVRAVAQAVNVHERDLRRSLRRDRRCQADKDPMHCSHRFSSLPCHFSARLQTNPTATKSRTRLLDELTDLLRRCKHHGRAIALHAGADCNGLAWERAEPARIGLESQVEYPDLLVLAVRS